MGEICGVQHTLTPGVLPEKLGGVVRPTSQNPYPNPNMTKINVFLLPYL